MTRRVRVTFWALVIAALGASAVLTRALAAEPGVLAGVGVAVSGVVTAASLLLAARILVVTTGGQPGGDDPPRRRR